MNNILLDVNIILDCFSQTRKEQFPDSAVVFNMLKGKNHAFISSSSLDNIAFIKADELRREYGYTNSKRKMLSTHLVRHLVNNFKIAKTPAYIEIDYDDIENSQIIA
jgi:hypothetical protein